jgi:hypothetical protein
MTAAEQECKRLMERLAAELAAKRKRENQK